MATAVQAPAAPLNTYVRFQINVPETVTLQDLGFESQGRYGPQRKFRLTDGRDMFVDLPAAKAIEESNAYPGDTFKITKLQGVDGTRRITWHIDKIKSGQNAQMVSPRIPPQPAARIIEQAEALDGTYGSAPSASQPPTKLETALRTAVSAASNVERYAAAVGYPVKFSPSDLRSMAISVMIEMGRGGGR